MEDEKQKRQADAIEVTQEMLNAGWYAFSLSSDRCSSLGDFPYSVLEEIYIAMRQKEGSLNHTTINKD